MKRAFILFFSAAALLSACAGYDDSALVQDIKDLDARVKTLETDYGTLKSDYTSISTLVLALKDRKYISNVTTTSSGWDVLLSDGTTFSVLKGDNSSASSLGVKKDTDGRYYFTFGGEYILIDGKKVEAAVGGIEKPVQPEFKIENSTLYIRYGSGEWQSIGSVGSNVVPAVSKVEETAEGYVFTLSGGTLVIPKAKALVLEVTGPSVMEEDKSADFSYTVTGTDASSEVVALASGNWKAVVSGSAAKGTITVTSPAEWEDGTVVVLASNSERVVMKSLNIKKDQGTPTISIEVSNVLDVPEEGGTFPIPVIANFEPVVEGAPAWMSVTLTRAAYDYTLVVAPNTGEARQGTVTFRNVENTAVATITVNQAAHVAAWTVVSEWPIQSSENKKYYNSTWVEGSPNIGVMPHETAGTITFDHSGSVAVGTSSSNKNKLDVPTTSSAYKKHSPRAYGTWEGDSWTFESLSGAVAGEKARIKFFLAGSANTIRYWKMEYLDGTEWKLAGDPLTVMHDGVQKTYTHTLSVDQQDVPFESGVTFSAVTEKITFRLTAVTWININEVELLRPEVEGGTGATGWIMLVAADPAAENYPKIEVFR